MTAIASDGSSITIGTHFGNILVGVTGDTVVNAPPDKNVGIGAVSVGDKVVVKLDRSPLEKVEAPEGDTRTATTIDTGAATGDTGSATTTDTGTATTTDTGFTIPGVVPTEAVAVAIGVLDASNDREGLIGLGGYGVGGIALHGVVFQAATTTATTTAATTDTGTATTTDTGAATTTDTAPPIFDPVPPDVDDLPPFRTVNASRITVIKSTRSHKRAIVTCETDATLEVVGYDGTVVELDDESTTEDLAATSMEPVAAAIASLEAYVAGEGLRRAESCSRSRPLLQAQTARPAMTAATT